MDNFFLSNMENRTGVNMDEIFSLANSLQNVDFKDEESLRKIIRKVGSIANKDVSLEVENKLVETIIEDGDQLDFATITDLIQKM